MYKTLNLEIMTRTLKLNNTLKFQLMITRALVKMYFIISVLYTKII